jgi:hypothetical protein
MRTKIKLTQKICNVAQTPNFFKILPEVSDTQTRHSHSLFKYDSICFELHCATWTSTKKSRNPFQETGNANSTCWATICISTRCMTNMKSKAKCALSLLIPLWQVNFWRRFTPQPFYVKAKPGSSNPYTVLGRPLRLQKIEAPRISCQSAHGGGKVVSPTRRVTGISGSSPDMYRRFRFNPWTGSV